MQSGLLTKPVSAPEVSHPQIDSVSNQPPVASWLAIAGPRLFFGRRRWTPLTVVGSDNYEIIFRWCFIDFVFGGR